MRGERIAFDFRGKSGRQHHIEADLVAAVEAVVQDDVPAGAAGHADVAAGADRNADDDEVGTRNRLFIGLRDLVGNAKLDDALSRLG